MATISWRKSTAVVLLLPATAVCFLTAGCGRHGGYPLLGPISPQQAEPGLEIESQFGGIASDSAQDAKVNRLTRQIAVVVPELDVTCRCVLLESESRAALSLSDGRIYLTRGLYRQLSEPMLAAIIAHEIAHVAARDGKSAAADAGSKLAKELRADRRACKYLQKAGFSTEGLVESLRLLAEEQPGGWAEARIAALAETSPSLAPRGE
jgi:Zn-dependent protease with chaperone function